MKLTDEQRAGCAKLLGYCGYSKADGGWHWDSKYLSSGAFKADDHDPGAIMLALLQRVADIQSCGEPVYELDIEWDRFDCAWDVTIRFEATEYVFGSSNLAQAVIGACLQLPEAQPDQGDGCANSGNGKHP